MLSHYQKYKYYYDYYRAVNKKKYADYSYQYRKKIKLDNIHNNNLKIQKKEINLYFD
jgi:hypothetical protein